mmetsp:Transcript_2281/g.6034  ORF Transcript_2281/g.6034 Transcript_2281/m.6034 type:complete len:86 (-) Transcript_2281:234-491(-)
MRGQSARLVYLSDLRQLWQLVQLHCSWRDGLQGDGDPELRPLRSLSSVVMHIAGMVHGRTADVEHSFGRAGRTQSTLWTCCTKTY